ncbi:MAG TPA: hypothetical protein VLR49_11065, partial [Ferruginibacter sp.]|nr:hypothetical protein [Ferruginibacter sp.]
MLSKATIKYIQSLQHKKFRDEEGVFIAEGPKLIKELLEGNIFTCKAIYALPEWAEMQSANLKNGLAFPVELIKDFELEKISSLIKPNQVLALFEKKTVNNKPILKNKISLVLDDIQD